MVVPVDREGKVGDCSQLHRDSASAASLEPVSTRKAGGRWRRKTNDEEPHKVGTSCAITMTTVKSAYYVGRYGERDL